MRVALVGVLLCAAALVARDGPVAPPADGPATFGAQACWQCHAIAPRVAGKAAFPAPTGSRRTGPVLGPELPERSEAWHLANLWAPRTVSADSAMPTYRALFKPPRVDVAAFVARHDSKDGSENQDGIVTRAEYGGDDWAAALARLDASGNGVISGADGVPAAKPGTAMLAKWLTGLARPRRPAEPRARAVPARTSPPRDKPAAITRGRAIYEQHCAGCHGVRADGDGPAAAFFGNHPPRNFLRGEYRYRSTPVGQPPLDADLFRTIRYGLGGSMPAWPSLSDRQVWSLVEFLKSQHPMHVPRELFVAGGASLAFVQGDRGEASAAGADVEGGRIRKRDGRWTWNGARIVDGQTVRVGDKRYSFRLGRPVYDWMDEVAPRPVTVPEPRFAYSAESAKKGAAVYREFGCASCHGEQGRGDGPAARNSRGSLGQTIAPADYTRGLKVGPDPRALVRLFLTGMHGTPMPGFASSFPHAKSAAPEDAPWHLAHFVMRQAGYRGRPGR